MSTTDLSNFISGEDVNTFGLHFICTPDTKVLTEKVRDQCQSLLNLARENADQSARSEQVTLEIIEDYESFACGESISTLQKSVRWKHVYLFSDPSWDFITKNERERLEKIKSFWIENSMGQELLMSLQQWISKWLNNKFLHDLLLLASIRDNWASSTNLVQSCVPYARQDKTTPDKRQSASIDIIWEWISNITWYRWYAISMDLHNPASRWAFKKTNFIDLYTWWLIGEVIERTSLKKNNITLSPADEGWLKSIKGIAKVNKLKNIVVIKGRDYSQMNTTEEIDIYGDIEWKDVIIKDDMLDTWWTMATLLREMLKKNPRSINIVITHGMLNWPAKDRLREVKEESNWVIQKLYITDSINKQNLPDFIEVIGTKNILANTITSIYKWLSINRWDNIDYTKK